MLKDMNKEKKNQLNILQKRWIEINNERNKHFEKKPKSFSDILKNYGGKKKWLKNI